MGEDEVWLQRTAEGGGRAIIHVDIDAFFAAVEQLRNPELRGLPVIVGGGRHKDGSPDVMRSVVSTCSYEAREYGVHSAMPMGTALRRCPQAIVVPVDMAAYAAVSARVFAIVGAVTPLVEQVSIDEAYLDVSGSQRALGAAPSIAARLRDDILAATGLHASFGVATSRVVAKVASDLRKPRGFVVVNPGDEATFLAPLPVRALPGVGPTTAAVLTGLGLHSIGQLARHPVAVLIARFGQVGGRRLHERSRGVDSEAVGGREPAKTISRETTFSHDSDDVAQLRATLMSLGAHVGQRLRREGIQARTVFIKVRGADFITTTRQRRLGSPTSSSAQIGAVAHDLFLDNWNGEPVRLVGVGVGGLGINRQIDLFDDEGGGLDVVLDDLEARLREAAPRRGVDAR